MDVSEDVSDSDEPREVALLEGLRTTRAIRRYRDQSIPPEDLAKMFFAATGAPSGSNIQPCRFLVLRDGPGAKVARDLMGRGFRERWDRQRLQYDYGSAEPGSRAARMGEVMQHFADHFADTPVIVLACGEFDPGHRVTEKDGGSVYPAVQNLLLAARALGYGGVLSVWHEDFEVRLRPILAIPENAYIFATIALGRPKGRHGPVRRLPLRNTVFEDRWGESAEWAVDPVGTRFSGPPPRPARPSDTRRR